LRDELSRTCITCWKICLFLAACVPPTLRIIETDSLNAYATGLHEGQYSVTVTRGLVNTLTRDEVEAVLAHELTHVINKDVRTMVIASIFAGIISVIAEMVFRGLLYSRGGRRDNKNAAPLIMIGIAFAVIGFVLAFVVRMMLSRTREFVADAGAVELTKNPDAMISALRKVEGRSSVKGPDEVQQLFLDNQPNGVGLEGLFATHPADPEADRRPGEIRGRGRSGRLVRDGPGGGGGLFDLDAGLRLSHPRPAQPGQLLHRPELGLVVHGAGAPDPVAQIDEGQADDSGPWRT
jgi:hypothetical protein